MKLPDLPFKLPDWPRRVKIAMAVLAVAAILFAALYPTLGISRDDALERVVSLTNRVSSTESSAIRAAGDVEFVTSGKERYERLIAGDKLVPHARRDAVAQLQALGREYGLAAVNFSFKGAVANSPTAAMAQPKAGEYRVNVDAIEIEIDAPTDGMIYGFIAALQEDFPGALVVDSFEIGRATDVTLSALDLVARGLPSQLASGKLKVTWRTAQRQEQPAKTGRAP